MAIGTSVTTLEEPYWTMKKVAFQWATASSSSGGVTATTTYAYSGEVKRLVTVPGAGALAPTASYDIVILDQDSTDILMGAGADRHTANTEQVNAASLGVIANDTMTLNITNAGSSNAGVVYVYVR